MIVKLMQSECRPILLYFDAVIDVAPWPEISNCALKGWQSLQLNLRSPRLNSECEIDAIYCKDWNFFYLIAGICHVPNERGSERDDFSNTVLQIKTNHYFATLACFRAEVIRETTGDRCFVLFTVASTSDETRSRQNSSVRHFILGTLSDRIHNVGEPG